MNDRSHFKRGGNLSPLGIAHMSRVILIGRWARRRALCALPGKRIPKKYNQKSTRALIKTL
jgi:hypothetical protein